jgi:hypothetical protein
MSERANTDGKTYNKKLFEISLPFCFSLLQKYSGIEILCSSITFTKRELKDHLMTGKEGTFPLQMVR